MEVLSVNQFNGQFTFGNGVKGGWSTTSPSSQPSASSEEASGEESQTAHELLARELARELRSAKQHHLACSEVLLPSDLLTRAASEIVALSECEPCGVRGCTIYVEFEPASAANSNAAKGATAKKVIACVKPDESTVSTFELYLTLKQENGWTDRLPQFLKNLTRGGTVVISPDFTLSKTLLYRSYRDS